MPLKLYHNDANIKARMSSRQLVAMTIWAESRSQPIEGQIAVGCIIRNRMMRPQRFGETWAEVCLKKWQFSCWIPEGGEANYRLLMERCEMSLKGVTNWPSQANWIAQGIIEGIIEDQIAGANHYYNPEAMKPRNKVPEWAVGQSAVRTIGDHLFFKLQ